MDGQSFTPYQEHIIARKPKDYFLRFFSQRYARRYSFGALSELERIVLTHTISSAEHRLVYVKNSKAACSTVASLLYQHETGHVYEGNTHYAPIKQAVAVWPSWRHIPKNCLTFSTGRSPRE